MSYSIGDESDDEFGLQPTSRVAATTSSSRQPHHYADPFSDNPGADTAGAARTSKTDAGTTAGGYTDSLIFDDYSGGQSANPLGTATEVQRNAGPGSTYNRYDVYDDDADDLFEDTSKTAHSPKLYDEGIHVNRLSYNGNASQNIFDDSHEAGLPGGASTSGSRMPIKSMTGSQGFLDEDDEEQIKERNNSNAIRAASRASGKLKDSGAKVWDSVLNAVGLGGPKDLTGERTIYINDQPMNAQFKFLNNYVSTGKYNLITFVPKFLAEQFSKYANVFFLFTAAIMQIPGVSPTNRYTTVLPLSLVLLVAAFKEIQEDLKRHQSDRELNARKAKVLQGDQFVDKPWRNIKVGDIVRLESNEFFPADLILLSSSEPEALCYIETSNLDGETNLKIKQGNPATANLTSPEQAARLNGHLRSEQPNNSLYTYEGTLVMNGKDIPLDPSQMLLRGAQLRNTAWMYGLVVFSGHETKLMRNATATPIKRTAVEKMVNTQILFLFGILLALSIGSSVGAMIRTYVYAKNMWYIDVEAQGSKVKNFIEDILTFIILYNNLIPISLIVTMEVVKFQQAILINSDLDMYHAPTDTPALCRTSSLVEELGQIEYIFSDKTGTLTQNVMIFRECTIAGQKYADSVDDARKGEVLEFTELKLNTVNPEVGSTIREFLTLLSTCHTVIPEQKGDKIVYQASSPDEAALVQGAEMLDYRFTTRKPTTIIVNIEGKEQEFEVLNICEFNSTRKRMSAIVRGPDGKIKIYCKGADTVILERLGENNPYIDVTLAHLEEYATEGLRTLAIAMREIPEDEYQKWAAIYNKAAATINGRQVELDKAAELIERNLFLLGATAIEDKLQDGVPEAIYTLQQAGIKVWVLTGDRQETAINIGLSCRLISESMSLVIVNEESAHDTKEYLSKKLSAIKAQRNTGDLEELALIIDGKSLTYALEKDLSPLFLELAIMCKAVVCCRVSPLQKALVVKLVKKNMKSILLAIGDGANDVSMIQAAHVGIGISGVEGLQAARSADVAISQFRFLTKLLLVHGTWSYQRLSKLILYSFYKNIVLYLLNTWFAFFNSFSGQVLFESWTLTFYNVIFTVLPPVVLGVFDQFVSARMLDRYPEQYQFGQRNAFFNVRVFWQWIGNALFHCCIIFFASLGIQKDEMLLPQGWVAGQWVWGTTVYVATLVTVLLKAALISDLWTKYTVAAIPGSFVFAMVFLPLYQLIAPLAGVSTEYQNIVPRLWGNGLFWFTILVLPVFCLCRDLAWKSYKRFAHPEPYHIVQEIQKLNLPDYRPRKTQFSQAIKKIRALQRTRRNRGFAFSQTEESQERIIRSYDTTVPKAKG